MMDKTTIKMLPSTGKPNVQAAVCAMLPLLLEGLSGAKRDEEGGNLPALEQGSEGCIDRRAAQGTQKTRD
ncbi:MAG: hypothetical protein AB7P69_25825 [Candidatus Binatia bacterium]